MAMRYVPALRVIRRKVARCYSLCRHRSANSPYPQPSIPVWLISDREGLWGRTCPDCQSYFRTNCIGDTHCPYCGFSDKGLAFTTANQLRYIERICNAYIEALNGGQNVTVDLNAVIDELPDNRPQWMYSEERQQTRFDCRDRDCRTTVDILGEYGGCPRCGKRNLSDVFEAKISGLESQFTEVDETLTERHEREVEWEKLLRCASEFEAMANDIKRQLLSLPAIAKRKGELEQTNFLRIETANARFLNWYGFEILDGISLDDRRFLNTMFNRRHIFAHNAGRVDQEYLDNTGDNSVRLNEKIRVKSKEIRRLIPLVKQAGRNLITGFESIE